MRIGLVSYRRVLPDMNPMINSREEAVEDDVRAPEYWGVWASFGWGVLGYVLILLAQLAALYIPMPPTMMEAAPSLDEASLSPIVRLGWVIGLSFPLALLLITIFVVVVIRLKNALTLQSYLGWYWVPVGTLLTWLGCTLLFELGMASTDVWFERPRSPEFLVQAYAHPGSLALLWFSIVVAGPIAEELLFRGLVLPSWSASRMGPTGAVVLVAFLFAAVHIQYDLYNQVLVFIIGILLGMARISTGSLLTPIAMHVLINFTGMLVVAYDQSL